MHDLPDHNLSSQPARKWLMKKRFAGYAKPWSPWRRSGVYRAVFCSCKTALRPPSCSDVLAAFFSAACKAFRQHLCMAKNLILRLQVFYHLKVKRSEEHTSELQSRPHLVCRLLLEKKKKKK